MEKALFGAGCFWGVEEIIRKIPGILKTEVGYAGGHTDKPTYNQVKTGETGHAEVIYIEFDETVLSYRDLLHYFFRLHNPTTLNRQENDIGSQYRSVIFCADEKQKETALEIKIEVELSKKWRDPIVTIIQDWAPFFSAEDYHQDYLQKNPTGYNCHYLRD
ncbi:MAG: peptide-methionine (S)-S-oxide reductase MsrA [Bacteriovoracaceae bacterium]|nr:peptide-methionine (S)-S-oxide reductase MsrA [Bacteriovoracaceae bacterium]